MSHIVPKHSQFIIIVLLLILWPCFLTVCFAKSRLTITTDQLALLALKSRITELSSHHRLSENWTIGSYVCDWIGVTCGPRHQRVTALDISDMNLTGTIPPHLGNLSFLVSLDMSGNNFNGELPDELARFRRLKTLDLSFNDLNGQFPSWIGSFHRLEYLSLRDNKFTGVIPHSIFNISKLTALIASSNDLGGNLPTEFFNMSSLERISLSFNGFSAGSSLPDDMCQRLPKLKWLDLERTGLVGRLPSKIGQCSQLVKLILASNSLNGGAIPREIGNLSMLQVVDFSENNFTGVIPNEIGNLSMLRTVGFQEMNLTVFAGTTQ